MNIDQPGAAFIAHFESAILSAYPDPGTHAEPWTIGIGATKHDGQGPVRPGMRISLPVAIARFRQTMNAKYGPAVLAAVRAPLKQHEFDVLASFHYNTGAVRSGSVDDRLNRGDVAGALVVLGMYTKAAGRTLPGLVRRRQAEVALWKSGVFPPLKIAVMERQGGPARYIAPAAFPWDVPASAPPITIDYPEIALPEKRLDDSVLWQVLAELWRVIRVFFSGNAGATA